MAETKNTEFNFRLNFKFKNLTSEQEKFINMSNKLYSDLITTIINKNNDYNGDSNIDMFKNFYSIEILGVDKYTGLLVRALDKVMRINTLLKQDNNVKNESINDSISDLIGYMLLLNGLLNKEKLK